MSSTEAPTGIMIHKSEIQKGDVVMLRFGLSTTAPLRPVKVTSWDGRCVRGRDADSTSRGWREYWVAERIVNVELVNRTF